MTTVGIFEPVQILELADRSGPQPLETLPGAEGVPADEGDGDEVVDHAGPVVRPGEPGERRRPLQRREGRLCCERKVQGEHSGCSLGFVVMQLIPWLIWADISCITTKKQA